LRHKFWCILVINRKSWACRSFSKYREKMADPGQDPNT
jgi:hypothetical protein